jgi:hypothetical protein
MNQDKDQRGKGICVWVVCAKEEREVKGYEMVYYRVTRWGTKLWCLLASYIEKYKMWRSKGEARLCKGYARLCKARQRQSRGKAKVKQR